MTKARTQLEERICPECGKSFTFRDQWAYKLIIDHKVVNYCSWTCMRKNERKKENGRTGIRAEQTANAVPDADAVPGAAAALGMDASAVDDAGKEIRK